MSASKYFSHWPGLNRIYYHRLGRNQENKPLLQRDYMLIFVTGGGVSSRQSDRLLAPFAEIHAVSRAGGEDRHCGYLIVRGETPLPFRYCLHRSGRDDLRFFRLSDLRARNEAEQSAYIVVEEGRQHFENIEFIRALESGESPLRVINIRGAQATRIYRVQDLDQLRQPK